MFNSNAKKPRHLVLRYENWIEKEQAKSFFKMQGKEAVDTMLAFAVYKVPREVWLQHKGEKEFLQSIKEHIAAELGICLLEKGLITFERQELNDDNYCGPHAIEFSGSVEIINSEVL